MTCICEERSEDSDPISMRFTDTKVTYQFKCTDCGGKYYMDVDISDSELIYKLNQRMR